MFVRNADLFSANIFPNANADLGCTAATPYRKSCSSVGSRISFIIANRTIGVLLRTAVFHISGLSMSPRLLSALRASSRWHSHRTTGVAQRLVSTTHSSDDTLYGRGRRSSSISSTSALRRQSQPWNTMYAPTTCASPTTITRRFLASYPPHEIMGMPSLSPVRVP